MRKLDVILRSCQRSMLESLATKDSSKLSRICGDDREKMVLKCLDSLVSTINEADIDLTFTILDDHSSESFLEKMESSLKQNQKTSKIVRLKEKGFNHSAYQQFSFGISM